MRWLLSVFRFRTGLPRLREFPLLLAKCILLGVITGPFWAAFFTFFNSPYDAYHIFLSPRYLFITSAIGAISALCFFVPCGPGNWYLRSVLKGFPPAITRVVFIVYNAVACSLAAAVSFSIVAVLPFGVKIDIPFFPRIIFVDGAIGAVLALVISAFMRLKMQVEESQAKVRELAIAASQAQTRALQSQARALQSQINPHFFFNTLNTISALVDDDPVAARQTIGRLADLFRYTLGCTNADAVTLGEEVQFVRDYLSIERARFRKRLRVDLPEGELPDVRIPGLVLQPLVENAIKHGIAPLIDGGSVSVSVARSAAGFRVSVRNTADEHELPELAAMFRPGHALDNVRARLRLFTGVAEPLSVDRGADWVEFSFDAPAVV